MEDQVMTEAQGERQQPEVAPERKAAVGKWLQKVKAAEKYWEKDFKAMRRDMDLARMGADGAWIEADNYVANVIQRHVNQKVAALYARNPRAAAKRRPRLEFSVWDGNPQTAMMAQQAMQAGAANEETMAILADIAEGQARMTMLNRMGKTLEICFHYYLDEQEPRFKKQAKMLVRRAIVCGVAYLKQGFQRVLEPEPDVTARISDVTDQIATLERRMADVADGVVGEDEGDLEALREQLRMLQDKEYLVVREGPVAKFPPSTHIVPDPRCVQLDGFIGAGWVAEKFYLTPERVKEVYKVDIGKNYSGYRSDRLTRFEKYFAGTDRDDEKRAHEEGCIVWEVWCKETGQVFTVAEGYPDYLREPAEPKVRIERFWPWLTLTFNDISHETELFPGSDVRLLYPMQEEYNRSRQGLREHRRANRPKYATRAGALTGHDKDLLLAHPANAILELQGLMENQTVDQLLQRVKTVPIDPAVYDTNTCFEDMLRVVGSQEANFGPTAGKTATESSIAESSRISVQSSDVDSLDELLTDFARAEGQIMLMELSPATVQEIVGPGAVWPQLTNEEIAKEVLLEVKAGSSGRPNRAAELANLERITPLLVQIPGISPYWLAETTLQRLDDGIDISEAVIEGMPSIVAMNTMARQSQPGTGDPATDPTQQGEAGGDVTEDQGNRDEPGPQPAFPA